MEDLAVNANTRTLIQYSDTISGVCKKLITYHTRIHDGLGHKFAQESKLALHLAKLANLSSSGQWRRE